jgi:hypothetical protein
MTQNRYLPYGYKIESGKTVIEPQEAEIIRRIYQQYAEGLSYKKIAELLTQSGVRYMPDKPQWNKNMVSRILQNQSYLGTVKYPALLKASLQQAAEQMAKPYTHTESSDIKMLKPLLICGICGTQIRRRLKTSGEERWYCPSDVRHIGVALTDETLLSGVEKLQNHLAENRHLVRTQRDIDNQINIGVIRTQNEIDLALSQQGSDHARIQQTIMELATQKYTLIQDTHGDGKELKTKIAQLPDSRLDSKLMQEILSQIQIKNIKATAFVLKNGQIIPLPTAEKGEPQHE